ncbi:hypothetical protein K9L16_02125 [Candidatus Pacearchaeota archaeon]|nr:hypothetical protein [Candidatus Pacearchaeota archaeon]
MAKKELISNKVQGVLLLIAATLLYVPLIFVPEKLIAATIIFILGIYNLVE